MKIPKLAFTHKMISVRIFINNSNVEMSGKMGATWHFPMPTMQDNQLQNVWLYLGHIFLKTYSCGFGRISNFVVEPWMSKPEDSQSAGAKAEVLIVSRAMFSLPIFWPVMVVLCWFRRRDESLLTNASRRADGLERKGWFEESWEVTFDALLGWSRDWRKRRQ